MIKLPAYIIPLLISAAVFAVTLHALFATPYAIGIDGYYYAAQIRSYWEKGRFFAHDSSWVLYAMAYFSRLGPDIVVMNKVFVAAVAIAFFWSLSSLLSLFTARGTAIVLAAAFYASAYLQFFQTNFIKNFVGLTAWTILLTVLSRRLKGEAAHNRIAAFFALALSLGACIASHTLVAFLAILSLSVFLCFRMHSRVIFAAIALALGVFIWFYRSRLVSLDITDFFTTTPFPRQAAAQSIAAEAYAFMAINLLFLARFVFSWIRARKLDANETLIAILIIATANPFYNAAGAEWGFRLHLVSLVATAAALASLIPGRIWQETRLWRFTVFPLALIFFALGHQRLRSAVLSEKIDYREIETAVQKLDLPPQHLLVAHQGFDYFYCYSRKGDAFHYLAEEKHRGRPVFRVLHGFPDSTLESIRFKQPPQRLTENYRLIHESDFLRLTEKLSPIEKKLLLTFRNPTVERDLFLRERDRAKPSPGK